MSTVSVSKSVAPEALHSLTETTSFFLDIVRLSAAILVVVSHSGLPEFHTGLPDRQLFGAFAVPVFFVLSGFVIRYVTRSREHTPRDFFIDRASRMYSVIVPAMVLTLLASFVCYEFAPEYYLGNWSEVSDHAFTRILLNLTFLSQSWGHNTLLFLNIPFWSLAYEGLYYIAYGIFFYLRGPRRILALLLWAAIAGPQVIFLLPIWILGCWIYDLHHAIRQTRAARVLGQAVLAYALLATVLYIVGSQALFTAPLRADLAFGQLANPLSLLHVPPVRATMLAFGTGVSAGVAMLLLLLISDLIALPEKNIWFRRFRHLADGTFSIYLMHYPLMVLATTFGFLRPHSLALNLTTLTLICLFLILLARPLDLFKVVLRTRLRRLIH